MRQAQTALLILATVGLFWLGATARSANHPDTAADIRTLTGVVLQREHSGPDSTHEALLKLVDVAAGIATEGRLPEAVQATLENAQAQAKRYRLLDDRARAALASAYAALNAGHAFVFPPEITAIDSARAVALGGAQRSIAALEGGEPEAAARELLGFVLIAVTPIEAAP